MAIKNMTGDGPILWDDTGSSAPVVTDGPPAVVDRRIFIV
jgi:hypothetical protein